MNLHYYKCSDCLSVITNAERFDRKELKCSCGGAYNWMGQAGNKRRLYQSSQEAPCDCRCTTATGPKCSCSCGGKHHGTRKLVTVSRDGGNVPSVVAPDDKAHEVAIEFRAKRDEVHQAYQTRYPDNGAWLARDDWDNKVLCLSYYRDGAFKAKSHKGRMSKFDKAMELISN